MGYKKSMMDERSKGRLLAKRSRKPAEYVKPPTKKGKSEADKLRDAAMDLILERLILGPCENFSALCKEFNQKEQTVRARMTRGDWPTHDRILVRKEEMLVDLTQFETIHRPDGMTECDEAAKALIIADGIGVPISKSPRPTQRDKKKPGPKTRGKELTGKELGDAGSISERVRGNEGEEDTSVCCENESAELSNTHEILAQPEMTKHDVQVAKMVRDSVNRAAKLKTIPVTKVGDLRILDDLYRRATHQKSGTGAAAPILNVNFLQQVGGGHGPKRHDPVKIDSSTLVVPDAAVDV